MQNTFQTGTPGVEGVFCLIKYVHSKESQQAFWEVIFHFAFIRQLSDENALCGHTGILVVRKSAGLPLGLGAGAAQGAAAGSHKETGTAFASELFGQTNLGSVMGCFCLLDGCMVG